MTKESSEAHHTSTSIPIHFILLLSPSLGFGLGLGAALDGGPFNITVNSLRPGVVDTPLTARPSGIHDPADGREYTVAETYGLMAEGGSQPIRRIGTPEDIAQAAYAFSHIPYMTGQFVAVDGGFTLAGSFSNREVFLQEGLRLRRRK